MALETAGHLSDHGTQLPGTGKDAPKQHGHANQQLIEDIVARAIDRINAADIPESEKARLRDQLRGALDTGDLSAVGTILANVATQLKTEEARDDVADLNYLIHESYPEYAEYSNEGRKYIRDSLKLAHDHSATFRALETEYAAIPKELQETARDQQKKNWEALNELRNDPEKADKYREELAIMRRLNMPNMPQGEAIIQMMKDGRDPAEVRAAVDKVMELQAKVVGNVIGEVVPNLKQESQQYIHDHYGNPPDPRKMLDDWAKISVKDRDAIYKAMASKDTSALSDEQRKLMPQVQHLSAVMIAADGAQTMYAGIEMAKDKRLEAQLKDKSLSVEARGELVETYMANHNFTTMDKDARDKFAREFIETIDKHPEAFEYARKGQIDKVGALYQAEIYSDIGQSAGANYSSAATSFVLASRIDAVKEEVPDWVKADKVRYAAYLQDNQFWAKLEKISLTTEEEQAFSKYEEKKPSTAAEQAATTVNTPAMTISPAFSLPPGIDPKDLKALAQAGVSNPELASPANEKQPNTQQSIQVAEAEIGGRQG